MIWLLAALDLTAGVYLLRRALPRQRRDRDLVLAVGVMLLVCAAVLVGIGGPGERRPPLTSRLPHPPPAPTGTNA